MTLDLIIRGGTVVDGSGGPRFRADVAVAGDRIVGIGRIKAPAQRVLDADGLIVAPGFIDGHTHMDAQVAWDPLGSCSCWHGVTSVVMGNCGFALAPCKADEREWFARCLTAVEDIPTEAIMAGVDWRWESFPQYLDAIDSFPKAINYGAYIGHSAIRMYVMGRRAMTEKATDDDIERMRVLVREALAAGAMGFSTSRSPTHTAPGDVPVASRIADWREVERIAAVLAEEDAGIFQIAPDTTSGARQRAFLDLLRGLALAIARPVMFGTISTRQGEAPNPWQYQTEWLDDVAAAGGRVWGQTTTRSINAIFSPKSYLPFDVLPAWQAVRSLPIAEQRRRFADPDTRRDLVAAEARMKPRDNVFQGGGAATTDPRKPDYDNLFALTGVDWDEPSVAALARTRNTHPVEAMLDLMASNEDQVFVQPLVNERPDEVLGLLQHPRTLATFSDSGAHVAQEMGSSLQTHMLNYWVRQRGAFTLEQAVRKMTFDIASAWDLRDRGLLRPGMAADIVVFDEKSVKPLLPVVERDLPGGARRLVQKAQGIDAVVVGGAITQERGTDTGARPGRLLRRTS
ncbi:amidohydrolase family protein [Reyranella sp. CPCC 100927]|uniref:N-acyl-D-amino-acid deacylase family protein n=1 Tax=Reyranella sp. CPCC 100927 TaxID=2599616 RepID=UPI0011B52DE0|nr:amidohydrolase family protein [Reyranella sp. CPCC 100927]TWT00296.1 amidohydrolase family protein [Reyranella sp. CPCC 100927]